MRGPFAFQLWPKNNKRRSKFNTKDIGAMLIEGVINPAISSLLGRVRHTNTLLISDRGFPSLVGVETIDISLVQNVPTVLEVIRAIRPNFRCGKAIMSTEFRNVVSAEIQREDSEALNNVAIDWQP